MENYRREIKLPIFTLTHINGCYFLSYPSFKKQEIHRHAKLHFIIQALNIFDTSKAGQKGCFLLEMKFVKINYIYMTCLLTNNLFLKNDQSLFLNI